MLFRKPKPLIILLSFLAAFADFAAAVAGGFGGERLLWFDDGDVLGDHPAATKKVRCASRAAAFLDILIWGLHREEAGPARVPRW